MFIIHQSQVKCWLSCRRKYYYRYVLGLEKRKPPNPLMRGTIAHEMIEQFLDGLDPWEPFEDFVEKYERLFREEKEEYGNLPREVETLMRGYFEWYKKDPLTPIPLHKGSKKKSEHKFSVELTPSILLEGKVDAVATDMKSRTWLVDHKTHKKIPEGDLKYSDIQSALYCWALNRLHGIKFDGVAWNYIRWKSPAIPEVLKNGEMSRRKNIDTTWDVYRAAVIEAGLDPEDYEDMEEALEGKENDFYIRSYLPVNNTMLENLVEETVVTAREIKRKAGKNRTRTIERHCQWCEYYGLCQAELRGHDADWIKKNDFVEKKKDLNEAKTAG